MSSILTLSEVYSIQLLLIIFVSDLGLWISIDTFATSVNKSYKNDIAKIVLKAALNTQPFVHKKQIIEI